MDSSDDSSADLWKAYPKANVDLWDQNVVNGEYVVAFEINPGLHPKLKNLLPKVGFYSNSLVGINFPANKVQTLI